jgi:diadenosine tetraphosphate (Ap4A) HIT family hydrolase
MTQGHLLVCVRGHREKIEHVDGTEGRELGFWLPVLAKAVKNVTGVGDYNIVQNNGMFYPSHCPISTHYRRYLIPDQSLFHFL